MFQTLISLRDRPELMSGFTAADKAGPEHRSLVQFISGIKRFAFYDDLKSVMSKGGLDIEGLIAKGRHTEILEYLLTGKGLNYSKLPKGLISFHRYPDHCRTPIDEQLVEAAATVLDKNGVARVHFTVSPEHKEAVESHVEKALSRYEKACFKFEITVSIQKPSTDTLAVDLDNRPFRDREGKLVFRPGGHGGLLENLNDLGGDIVFIKNIDNVVPDRLKEETTIYKKALGGVLVELQREIFGYLKRLSRTGLSERELAEVFEFASCKLSIAPPDGLDRRSVEERTKFLFAKLNRPLRVCGVVKSLGEPGGGGGLSGSARGGSPHPHRSWNLLRWTWSRPSSEIFGLLQRTLILWISYADYVTTLVSLSTSGTLPTPTPALYPSNLLMEDSSRRLSFPVSGTVPWLVGIPSLLRYRSLHSIR